jgi:hypothetical protein
VDVDQDLERRIPRPERGDDRERRLELALLEKAVCRPERVELQCPESLLDDGFGRGSERVRGALVAVPAVRVRGHRVAHAAADELVNRHAERLAEDVPARDFDRRDRVAVHVPALVRDALV